MGATSYSRLHSRHRRPCTYATPTLLSRSPWGGGPALLDALSSASSGDPLIGYSSFRHWHLAVDPSIPSIARSLDHWLPRLHWACPSAALDERVRPLTLLRPRRFDKPRCAPCVG